MIVVGFNQDRLNGSAVLGAEFSSSRETPNTTTTREN